MSTVLCSLLYAFEKYLVFTVVFTANDALD